MEPKAWRPPSLFGGQARLEKGRCGPSAMAPSLSPMGHAQTVPRGLAVVAQPLCGFSEDLLLSRYLWGVQQGTGVGLLI